MLPPKNSKDQIFLRGTEQVYNNFYTLLNDDLPSARLSVCVLNMGVLHIISIHEI